MPQSLSQIWLHVIFSTKNRAPLLPDTQVREKVHAYLAGICNQMKSPALIVGGIADHVHILCNQSKNVALKDEIQNVKQDSSKWIKRQWSDLDNFYWQQGYGAFSVSPPHVDKVRNSQPKRNTTARSVSRMNFDHSWNGVRFPMTNGMFGIDRGPMWRPYGAHIQ